MELDQNRPDLALEEYRKLLVSQRDKPLALSRIARCLAKLGRTAEARATWRQLAAEYPDERDLSHRPYGIIAAIEAGDTHGVAAKIVSGRWDLPGDQAEYFLTRLGAGEAGAAYLARFHFARELSERFHPAEAAREGELYGYRFGVHQIYYRTEGGDRIRGVAVNTGWVMQELRPRLERELGIGDAARRNLLIYGSGVAVVLLIVGAGVWLLLRDLSRESAMNRLRADFVSGVTHDLKTPIAVIRLYSDILLRRGGDEDLCSFYRIIAKESDRLGRLVDRVLVFSRIERGDQEYRFEEGDPAPVIARAVDEQSELLERAGFVLKRDVPPVSARIRFDAAAVTQAVANLLDNAVKYSGESKEIAVSLATHNGSVIFEVEDHGAGIPAEEQPKVFDRYYRVANGSGTGGYGLGLYLVRHTMEAHGGRAELDSEPDRGSRFRLVFPVAER
jgi:signal transduction histidine kinase